MFLCVLGWLVALQRILDLFFMLIKPLQLKAMSKLHPVLPAFPLQLLALVLIYSERQLMDGNYRNVPPSCPPYALILFIAYVED